GAVNTGTRILRFSLVLEVLGLVGWFAPTAAAWLGSADLALPGRADPKRATEAVRAVRTNADWTRFRGSHGAGISEDAQGLPTEFGPNTNLAWRMAVRAGCSSPVASGSRVWLAGYEGNRRSVLCLDLANGRRLWEQALDAIRTERKSEPNDAASSTPVTDGVN